MKAIDIIIPAYNEENSVGKVVTDIPKSLVRNIIVVDNNSSDKTRIEAKKAGAKVLHEPNRGYGYACLKGIEYAAHSEPKPDIIVFLDADYSDYPEQMDKLVNAIVYGDYDLVIGSRAIGKREKGSMTPQQIFGNRFATWLMKLIWKAEYTDLGPFRAIKFDKLIELNMQDKTYGWTIEMQLKAVKQNFKYCELPVNYRKRIGKSKVSGTVKGTIMAGYKIITSIFKYL